MTRSIISLDLETTGLDPKEDAIIEIGAVKFEGDRVVDEFDQLINPGQRIPGFISQLTGINNAMVVRQPALRDVIPDLEAFIGSDPILGHNVRFDLGFLRKHSNLHLNHRLDTYGMAAVLLPAAARYGLGSLAAALGVLLPATHRALDDARATHAVYRKLYAQALELPLDILAEIVRLGQDLEWWGGDWPLQEALRKRSKEALTSPQYVSRSGLGVPLFADKQIESVPLLRKEPPASLDIEALTALFEPGGALDQNLPAYEHRPEQVRMMQATARSLSEGQHLLVEAGTGTGKSLAYLAPAILWAWQNGQRVVISTNTINLQDQLIEKDLPAMQRVLGIEFKAALLKGRSNYVCPRRLENLRRHGPRTGEEMVVLGKLLVWLPESVGGDRSEITLTGSREREVWARLSAQDDGCTADRCVSQMGGICPFYRSRRTAENAHVIVVNHALLLADVASESRVLPEYHYLIVDESHHLEAATTEGLSFIARQYELERCLRDIGGPTAGLLGQVLSSCRAAIPPQKFSRIEREVGDAFNAISTGMVHSVQFFDTALEFVQAVSTGRNSTYALQLRLHAPIRSRAEWEDVELSWGNLDRTLSPVIEHIARVARGLGELEEFDIEDRDDLILSLGANARYLDEFAAQMNGLVSTPSEERIYWIELSNDGKRLSLHSAPLAVGPLVEQHIWHAKEAVVMTSATLTADGEFDYVRGRLNAEMATELSVGSPFNYKASTLLYVPTDIPEPRDRSGHQHAIESGLIGLCTATCGRTLVLFTSFAQLRQTAQAIRGPLERAGVILYDQTGGSSRHQLLESFKAEGNAVLLGTRSFWEGIDVPGDALSVLVIVKLPFDVPSDPIVAARSETFENPFMQYSVPEAILRFRQGFGRLIRTATDRGVVVVLDCRVTTKRYGALFLDSLPDCTRKFGPLDMLPHHAMEWLEQK